MKELVVEIDQYDERIYIVSDAIAEEFRRAALYDRARRFFELVNKYGNDKFVNLDRVGSFYIRDHQE
jgi:hypothetical protein